MSSVKQKKQNTGKVFTLISSDKKKIHVKEKALKECLLFSGLLESKSAFEDSDSNIIPVPDVKKIPLEIVMKFCELHMDDEPYNQSKDVQSYILSVKDKELFDQIDSDLFTEVILAANYLNYPRLIDSCLLYVHYKIRNMHSSEIRKALNVENDFTEEETDKIQGNRFRMLFSGILNDISLSHFDIISDDEYEF